MRSINILVGVIIGMLIESMAVVLAVMSAGAGHGHYEFARLFFPYTMLLTRLVSDEITWPLIVLALVQFPLYGAIIWIAGLKSSGSAAVAGVLLLVPHAVAVVFCFSGVIPSFS